MEHVFVSWLAFRHLPPAPMKADTSPLLFQGCGFAAGIAQPNSGVETINANQLQNHGFY
jgi:hypothetical protein